MDFGMILAWLCIARDCEWNKCPVKGTDHPILSSCTLWLCYNAYYSPSCLTNPYDILSSVEHKKRCETERQSQSPFTYIVGKKYAMQVNGDWSLTVCLLPNMSFCVPLTWIHDDRFYIFEWTVPLKCKCMKGSCVAFVLLRWLIQKCTKKHIKQKH